MRCRPAPGGCSSGCVSCWSAWAATKSPSRWPTCKPTNSNSPAPSRYANTWPDAIALAASGRVNLDALVTGHYGLADADQALTATTRDPNSIKVIVQPQQWPHHPPTSTVTGLCHRRCFRPDTHPGSVLWISVPDLRWAIGSATRWKAALENGQGAAVSSSDASFRSRIPGCRAATGPASTRAIVCDRPSSRPTAVFPGQRPGPVPDAAV
jgi:hypothetical protein